MKRSMAHSSPPHLNLIAQALVHLNEDGITGTSSVTKWTNSGTGGSAYDLDVVVGTGANGKPHPSGTHLFYGASGDYVSGAVLSITSNVAVAAYIDPDDITPAAISTICAQSTAGQIAFENVILTDGKVRMTISADGSAVVNGDSDDSIAGREWVLSIWDDTANDLNVYTAPGAPGADPTALTWTQLGTADIALSSAGMHNSTAVVEIGGNTSGTSERFNGNIGRVFVWSGTTSVTASVLTAGTEETDADPSNWTTGTTYSSGGDTITLQGNSFAQNSGKKVVHSIGSFGLETTAGQTISSPGTVFCVARFSDASPSGHQYLMSARSDNAKRWIINTRNDLSDHWTAYQGTTAIENTGAYDNNPHVFTGQFNGDATTKLTVSGVGNIVGDAGSVDFDFGTLGATTGGGTPFVGNIQRLLVFDWALNESQVKHVQQYLMRAHNL